VERPAHERSPHALRAALVALLICSALISTPPAFAAAEPGPALTVNGSAERHAISPYIYGLNFAEPSLATELSLPVNRWGGNATEGYNFKLGADNTGADYFYENIADCWNTAHNWCSGLSTNNVFAYREFVEHDKSTGSGTLLTLPLAGYVASNAPTSHPFTCGFPSNVFPSQDEFDPYDSHCGNGKKEGALLTSEPSRDGAPIGAAYDGEFVHDLVSRFGDAAHGGVPIYELGNEPGLWDGTHRDIHPNPTSYDELWEKSRNAAIAVKEQDASAEVLGFSEWGWPNYFCSAADGAPQSACTASSPDRAAHGGTALAEWLLQQFHTYEQEHAKRLLNYIDVHYYAQGGSNAEVTRSLWDPTYTDPSWINAKIDLLPRMHQWVASRYPGTKIALSEYNLSVSSEPLVNALIQADVLGIFAREGLDLATRWGLSQDGALINDAFRMYRNYDGAHGSFGDTWVSSQSAEQNRLAVYGAQRSSDGAYTLMVINKTASPLTSTLWLSGISPSGAAQVWRWTGGGIERKADQGLSECEFSATYPARSITLFVIPTSGGSSGPTGHGEPSEHREPSGGVGASEPSTPGPSAASLGANGVSLGASSMPGGLAAATPLTHTTKRPARHVAGCPRRRHAGKARHPRRCGPRRARGHRARHSSA
jgi:hypothetical protein